MILKADRIVTGDGKTIIEKGAVLVENDKIVAVDTFESIRAKYPKCEVSDFGDATIIPGMVDMHVHIGYYWTTDRNTSPFLVALMAQKTLHTAHKKGVTTIRDVFSPKGLVQALKLGAQQELITMPRIMSSHLGICMTGGHAWSLSTGVMEADGEVEIRKAIREQIRDGADLIKILSSHRTDTPEYTDAELAACVDECHRVNKRVAVHAGTQPSIESCINLGFDTIEHGTYMTKEQAVKMKQNGQVLVPTIVAYTYIYEEMEKERIELGIEYVGADKIQYDYFKKAADRYKSIFKDWLEAGVTMATGTDMVRKGSPIIPIEREMKYMSDYGMANIEVIKAATYNGAVGLGMESMIGSIECGKIADIAVIRGNLLEDITKIKDVLATYQGGIKVV